MGASGRGCLMEPTWPLGVGGRLLIDGQAITVSCVDGAEVQGFTAAGERVRFVLTRVAEEPARAPNEEWRFGSVLLDAGALSDVQLREAGELLAHLNETWFGYRSGDPGRPLPGEPRTGFDPEQTTLGDRLEVKAAELGCSVWKLYKKHHALEHRGLGALVDRRTAQSATGPGVDQRLREAILAEAEGLAESSDVRKMQFRSRVASRLARESGEPLVLPSSRQTFNRIVDEVLAPTGLFRMPAKSRRSAQSAPREGLGSLVAERPGEYVAIDTTSLDVFAIDPFTFQWVGLDLTAALDLCTRSILAFRQFGRHYERRCRARYPHELTPEGHEYLPVLYVNVDALPTIKGLNEAMLTFYGMGPPARANARQLTQLVLQCARLCQTSLIVIDDIHLLELRREADRDANNHLKRLANDLQATFLYAGVGLSHGGFMHEGLLGADAALAQISQRFKRLPVQPLRRSTESERALWLGVLSVFERELVLLASKDGDLCGRADYLWRRTQGVIGSLTQLLTEAAAEAIDTGVERITQKLLDGIDIGYAAEVGAGRQQPRRAA